MFFARISTARGSVFVELEVIGDDCAIVEIPPFDGDPVLHRAVPPSKNDAEELEPADRMKTPRFLYFHERHRESNFALCRETLPRVAALYAQTAKKQPNWLNMSRSRKHVRTTDCAKPFQPLG